MFTVTLLCLLFIFTKQKFRFRENCQRSLKTSNQLRSVFCREIQESELQKFYSRLMKLLQAKEPGHDTVDSLQRLHLILSATKYTRT